jgi:CheY-like chemotaxis protein
VTRNPEKPLKTIVWVIDDSPGNFCLVQRSLPANDGRYELVHYMYGEEALVELEAYLDVDGGLDHVPDVIFMDYFLGEMNGGQVTISVRRIFERSQLQGPYIIGHSSLFSCSMLIKTLGGDIAITKNPRKDQSRDIKSLFPDLSTLCSYAGRGQESLS